MKLTLTALTVAAQLRSSDKAVRAMKKSKS
jgi:hypothetical protein